MAIKFGDILENINAKRPIVDLIENNAKGLLFVSNFDDDSASDNNGVIGIPKAKRSPGSLVLDKTDGVLYCWPGVFNQDIDEHTANGDAIVAGSWEDTGSTSKWIEIGTIKKRTTVLSANINDGPDQISSAYEASDVTDANILATVNDLRSKINELITNPPRTFGKFLKGQELVKNTDTSGLTALEIIERAVTDILPYSPILVTSGTFQYYQPSGTTSLFATGLSAVNYDSLNDDGENIVPTSIRWYYRFINDATWNSVGDSDTEIAEGTFSDSTTATSVTGPVLSWANNSPANVAGIEFKMEVRDNSNEDHLSEASGIESGDPVVFISEIEQINQGAYSRAAGSFTISATDDESGEDIGQPHNWDARLRSKGNFGTTLSWTLGASPTNGAPNVGLTITDYQLQYRNEVNGTYGTWGNVTGTVTTGNQPSGSDLSQTSYSGTITVNTTGWDVSTTDSTQFKLSYTDANGTFDMFYSGGVAVQSGDDLIPNVGTIPIKYRMPIFVGFADVGGSLVETDFSNLTITEEIIKGLSCTPGGITRTQALYPGTSWDHNQGAQYGTSYVGADSFPLLVPEFGHADSADNVDMIYTNDNNFTSELKRMPEGTTVNDGLIGLSHDKLDLYECIFGWLHNKPADQADIPDEFPDELLGDGDTRLIMAVPDGGTNTSNHGLSIITDQFPGGITSGTIYDNNFSITNSYGASKRYVVSAMDSVGSVDSITNKRMLFKIDQL